ncbi:MAG: Hsp70 family protein, partial [Chitinophagaceae bacterium]
KDDMNTRALVEAKTEAAQMLDTTKRFLEKHRDLMTEEEIVLTHAHETALLEAIKSNDKNAIQHATESMNDATRPFAERLMDTALRAAMKGTKV